MPNFSVDGLQYYGLMTIANYGDGGVTTSFYEIFNNTDLFVNGQFNTVPSQPFFTITDNASIYNISITLTPVTILTGESFAPYFISPEFDGNQFVTMNMTFQEEGIPLQDFTLNFPNEIYFYINIQFIPI